MSITNQNSKKKKSVQLTPEEISVLRMKILEKEIFAAIEKASGECKKQKLGELTVYEMSKIVSKVQHHYATIGVEFEWRQLRSNIETLEEDDGDGVKTIPIAGQA